MSFMRCKPSSRWPRSWKTGPTGPLARTATWSEKRPALVAAADAPRPWAANETPRSQAEAQAVALAADVAMLVDWLRDDVLALAGPDHATRRELFDFIVAELRSREPLCPHRIGPVVRALANQRDDLLAFAAQLDRDLAALAAEFQLPVATLREVFQRRGPRSGGPVAVAARDRAAPPTRQPLLSLSARRWANWPD